eukprot:3595953-Rhodomonas_salina.2
MDEHGSAVMECYGVEWCGVGGGGVVCCGALPWVVWCGVVWCGGGHGGGVVCCGVLCCVVVRVVLTEGGKPTHRLLIVIHVRY